MFSGVSLALNYLDKTPKKAILVGSLGISLSVALITCVALCSFALRGSGPLVHFAQTHHLFFRYLAYTPLALIALDLVAAVALFMAKNVEQKVKLKNFR